MMFAVFVAQLSSVQSEGKSSNFFIIAKTQWSLSNKTTPFIYNILFILLVPLIIVSAAKGFLHIDYVQEPFGRTRTFCFFFEVEVLAEPKVLVRLTKSFGSLYKHFIEVFPLSIDSGG